MKTVITINNEQKEFPTIKAAFFALSEAGMIEGKKAKEVADILQINSKDKGYAGDLMRALARSGGTSYVIQDDTYQVQKIEVKKAEGLNHYQFPTVLKCLAAKRNVMMVGAAGSGKTTCAQKAAEHLSINFYSMSVGLQTSKSDFMGYMNATGDYVTTHFRTAYEQGGVFLIDEIDAGNPGIMTIVNAALANSVCAFPDKMVEKSKDFICCAAANTFGKGADRMYVGRNQLDAATLDRFVKLNFDYDEKLELALSSNIEWFNLIIKCRRAVEEKKLRVLVTPRATFNGCALLETGMNFWETLELTVLNGMSEEESKLVLETAHIEKSDLKRKAVC